MLTVELLQQNINLDNIVLFFFFPCKGHDAFIMCYGNSNVVFVFKKNVILLSVLIVFPQGNGFYFIFPQRNTFQAVLASSDSSSYAIFLYPEDGLQFYSAYSKNDDGKIPAMVGFSQASTNYYFWENPGSYNVIANDEDSIRNLHKYAFLFVLIYQENVEELHVLLNCVMTQKEIVRFH